MIRRPPRSTQSRSSAASDVYKRQGTGCPRSERRQAERRQENGTSRSAPPLVVSHNWPDTEPGAGTRKRADVWQVSLCRRTAGTVRTEGQVRHLMVNGPEDPPRLDLDDVDWDSIDWFLPEREVRRLRQRIFKACLLYTSPNPRDGL